MKNRVRNYYSSNNNSRIDAQEGVLNKRLQSRRDLPSKNKDKLKVAQEEPKNGYDGDNY